MKSSFLGLLAAGLMIFSGTVVMAQAQDFDEIPKGTVIADKILMYLPNRLLDFCDMISLDLESGMVGKAGVRITYAFGFGFDLGYSGKVSWDYRRTYGTALDESWQGYFFSSGVGKQVQDCIYGNLPEYAYQYKGFRDRQHEDVFTQSFKDYWAIEVKAAVLAGARVVIHPIEIADFICGIFCYDGLGRDDRTLLY